MSVYVDDFDYPFGRMLMSHMIADAREELDSMADRIGVARKWIQYPGTYREHYDVCRSMKAKAIALGAISITKCDVARITMERRVSAALRSEKPTLNAEAASPQSGSIPKPNPPCQA